MVDGLRVQGLAPIHFRVNYDPEAGFFSLTPLEGQLFMDGELIEQTTPVEPKAVWLACSHYRTTFGAPQLFLLAFNGASGEMWRPSIGAQGLRASEVTSQTSHSAKAKIALDVISFEVLPGEFICVMGSSGAGKSTLVELLLGCRKPTSGLITIGGDRSAAAVDTREQVSFCPQHLSLPLELTGRELLEELASERGVNLEGQANGYPRQIQLLNFSGFGIASLNTRVGSLSGGEYRRLCLCTSLVRKRLGLLILDEPTSGLDPVLEQEVALSLREISRHGITVVVITHSMQLALTADRVLVLRRPDLAEDQTERRPALAYYGRVCSQTELLHQLRRAREGHESDVSALDPQYASIIHQRFG